jgi:hypothetical protein
VAHLAIAIAIARIARPQGSRWCGAHTRAEVDTNVDALVVGRARLAIHALTLAVDAGVAGLAVGVVAGCITRRTGSRQDPTDLVDAALRGQGALDVAVRARGSLGTGFVGVTTEPGDAVVIIAGITDAGRARERRADQTDAGVNALAIAAAVGAVDEQTDTGPRTLETPGAIVAIAGIARPGRTRDINADLRNAGVDALVVASALLPVLGAADAAETRVQRLAIGALAAVATAECSRPAGAQGVDADVHALVVPSARLTVVSQTQAVDTSVPAVTVVIVVGARVARRSGAGTLATGRLDAAL